MRTSITAEEIDQKAEEEKWNNRTMLTLRFKQGQHTDESGRHYPTNIVYLWEKDGILIGFVNPNMREGRVEIPIEKLEDVFELTPLAAVMLLDSFRRDRTGSY